MQLPKKWNTLASITLREYFSKSKFKTNVGKFLNLASSSQVIRSSFTISRSKVSSFIRIIIRT